jgi:hypothetical protein
MKTQRILNKLGWFVHLLTGIVILAMTPVLGSSLLEIIGRAINSGKAAWWAPIAAIALFWALMVVGIYWGGRIIWRQCAKLDKLPEKEEGHTPNTIRIRDEVMPRKDKI